jgi:predicted AlkP superfamily phosphohydrolase/phosphomutase
VGVPPAYPPRPLRGVAISCFLTPSAESQYAYPQEVKGELEHAVGPYLFDVPDFRTDDKQRLLDLVYRVTEYKFAASRHLATHHEWDFFMIVDIGPDRLHHGFWKYCDPEHLKHEPGNPLRSAFEDYYRFLDVQVGTLLESLDDRTAVLVVSDHGAKRMDGGICLNEWLINEGYLVLRAGPTGPTRFEDAQVDWSRTAVWGEGGYYGRIFLNVKGREPAGTIPPSRYEALRDELIQKLEALGDEAGRPLGTRVYRPEELYPVRRGIAPDLIAIFGDLHWRSVGSVGLGSVWSRENDTGPDDANHAQQGIMIEAGIGLGMGRRDGMRLVDLSPIMLECFGIRH